MKFAIVDIETTGGNSKTNKITEIAIAVFENGQIVERFESLVNPQQPIPYFIQSLTGISNKMVADAPSFFNIAKDIVRVLEGCVFVAHNVKFDYNFIKNEFEELGYRFNKKQLCTVKLSRQYFPGLSSYGLDNLIKHFGINCKNRHRAMGDVLATLELFEKIYNNPKFKINLESHLYEGLTSKNIPKGISLELLANLPESCGNVFVHTLQDGIILATSTKNIKKTVIKIFRQPNIKLKGYFDEISDISYELSGNEIMASIFLENYLKSNSPILNNKSNKFNFTYIIFMITHNNGYNLFDFKRLHNKNIDKVDSIVGFSTKKAAIKAIDYTIQTNNLCRSINQLEDSLPCFNYHMDNCYGACLNKEDVDKYNLRFENAIDTIHNYYNEPFFVQDHGRQKDESCIYYFENRKLIGYFWIGKDQQFDKTNLLSEIIPLSLSEELNTRIISKVIANNTEYLKI